MFEIKFIFLRSSCMLQFSEFVWPLSYSVWDVFNNFLLIDATDRSKISSDQKRFFIALSLYPLLFFANTPFNISISILQSFQTAETHKNETLSINLCFHIILQFWTRFSGIKAIIIRSRLHCSDSSADQCRKHAWR